MNLDTASVLIASTRPAALTQCLESLAGQTVRPTEVIVAWQADDIATRDTAAAVSARTGLSVRQVHSPERGVVPAENAALAASSGDIVLLIDDDAVAPPDWVERHLRHYSDTAVGAVGGPYTNYHPDGTPFPKRSVEPVGEITWYGLAHGNMYDHDPAWRIRSTRPVHHLAGGNMSLRRSAFTRFETGLRAYWQSFELEVCLQVRSRGYRVLFDFGNVVDHFPTGGTFRAGREGDLAVKVYNSAYNHAFAFAKHLRGWRRAAYLLYQFAVGSVNTPGVVGFLVAARRYGDLRRELEVLRNTLLARSAGWRAGTRAAGREGR